MSGASVFRESKGQEGDSAWSEVLIGEGPEPVVSYRTNWVVYEEALVKGRFVGLGWNAAGYVNFYAGRIDPAESPVPQAFWLEIDGQLLASGWKWGGAEKRAGEKPGELHVVVTLHHTVRPVTVKVHTMLDGTPVMVRRLDVTHRGTSPAALSAAFSWSGVLQKTKRWEALIGDSGRSLYSVGYFENTRQLMEGAFRWFDLPPARYGIDGRYRRDRHRHPMFILRNNATGEHFIGQLAWSGGYSFEFDLDTEAGGKGPDDRSAMLSFKAGADAPPPQRILAPDETVSIPEMHMGVVFGGLDTAVQAMHDHLRRSVFPQQTRGRGGWIESGIGPEVEITPERVFHAIDAAADFGAEIWFIDAAWYAPPFSNWSTTVGDWDVDRARFPEGLEPFRKRVHEKGMLWGLWMEPERIGEGSRVAGEHPDWLAAGYDGEKKFKGLLDLTNPHAAQWMEETIIRVIQENGLDFFRLDYNIHPGSGIASLNSGYIENGYWRYYETLYAIFDRLRARFPDVVFENCAAGGGRTDIGMVRRFSHTWVTDWQIAPRSFSITNGMTMALPPEYVDRLLGGQRGHSIGDFDFQSRLLLFVRPSLSFLTPFGSGWNPLMLDRLKHWVALYKDFIRPFMRSGRIYHHTPEVGGTEPHGWGILELSSADRARAVCGLFQLSVPVEPEYLLRLRGLDSSRKYRVTWDSTGQSAEWDGSVLMHQGISVRLEGPLTSELLLFEDVSA